MKKLLSLLSVLTISGTAVPTTIAASGYQKEEILNRKKRQNNNFIKYNKKLIIDNNDPQKYKSSLNEIINYLITENILISVFENNNSEIYELNSNYLNSNQHLMVPVSIIDNGTESEIELVIRLSDFYIVGFINIIGTFQGNPIRNYYWLSDSDHPNLELRHIDNTVATDFPLQFDGHYNILLGGADGSRSHSINWFSIQNAFTTLHNWRNNNSNNDLIKKALGYIILVTSEALRFRSVFNLILNNIIEGYSNIYWNPAENSGHTNVRTIVTNWQSVSNNIIDAINNIQSRFGNNNGVINEWFYNLLSQLPLNTIAQALANTDVRVILGLLLQSTLNCNRKTRSINNNIKNEYCDAIKGGEEQNYPLKNKIITTIKVLDKDNKNKNLQKGDIFLGTTNGFYLISVEGKIINLNLNNSVKDIILYNENLIYVLSDGGEVFCLNIKLNKNRNNVLISDVSTIRIFNTNLEEIKILSIKKITKNSNDNYLKIGDIYAWTNDGGYLIRNQINTEKIVNNKHYLINHNDDSITEIHFNKEDNSYCDSTGKKIAAVSTATAIGASAGSVIPGLGTLIGAGIGALVGGIGSVFITKEICNHR